MEDSSVEVNNKKTVTNGLHTPFGLARKKCPFCAIVAKTSPAHVIFEENSAMAILDHRPISPGHCLVIPKSHLVDITQIPHDLGGELQSLVRRVVKIQRVGLGTAGVLVVNNNVVDQHVDHFHIHVIPRRVADGISIGAKVRGGRGGAPLDEVAKKLREVAIEASSEI